MQITNESLLEAAAARLLQDKASPRADATDFEHLSKLCSQCLTSVFETGTQHKSRSNLKTQGVQTDGQVLQGKPVVLADQRNSEMGVQTVGSIGKGVLHIWNILKIALMAQKSPRQRMRSRELSWE